MRPDDWKIAWASDGAICRSVMWGSKEVALVNPRGDFDEQTEKDLAAGIAFAAKMHRALRLIRESVRVGTSTLHENVAVTLNAVLCDIETVDTLTYVEPSHD